jgi:hypothetical protein
VVTPGFESKPLRRGAPPLDTERGVTPRTHPWMRLAIEVKKTENNTEKRKKKFNILDLHLEKKCEKKTKV